MTLVLDSIRRHKTLTLVIVLILLLVIVPAVGGFYFMTQ